MKPAPKLQPDKYGTLRDAREAYETSSHQLELAQKSSALCSAMAGGFYFLSTQLEKQQHPATYILLTLGTVASTAGALISLPALLNAIWDNYQKHRTFRAVEQDISILEREVQNVKRDNIPSSEL